MGKHVCVICYMSLPRAQITCGSPECVDTWHNMKQQSRQKRKNLATATPSERAFILSQTPEPQPDLEFINDLQLQAEQINQKKESPQFIREMLNPENLTIKEKEP